MENLLDTLKAERDNLKSDKNVIRLKRFEQMDYFAAFNTGSDWGKKLGSLAVNSVQGAFNKLTNLLGPKISSGDITGIDKYMKNGALPVTGKVDISEEDLKYLKDIAEREYINKYSTTTLAPNIKIAFTGPISKEADVDKLAGRIEKILKEQIATAAEGSYA
jgi:hypothetical protein